MAIFDAYDLSQLLMNLTETEAYNARQIFLLSVYVDSQYARELNKTSLIYDLTSVFTITKSA